MELRHCIAAGFGRAVALLVLGLLSVQAQTPNTAQATIRFPVQPWVERVESFDGVVNGYTSCKDQYGVYVGALKNGVPDGPGRITIECYAIPMGIGSDHIGETCDACSAAREWVGEFQNGELPFGRISLADGSTYEGPLFDLVPHGEGTVTVPDEPPFRQTFRFGWPVPRLSPEPAEQDDASEAPTQ